MKASCVIPTLGDRPAELSRAIASVGSQEGAAVEVIVVADGADVDPPEQARLVRVPARLGPPGARNRGIDEANGEVIFFLDDDGAFAATDVVPRTLAMFDADPALGIVSFRIDDPRGGSPQRRHVPRLRAGDPVRSSDVTTFLEGACAIRRTVFDRVGAYPASFEFGHEGTDLAWRALDAGFRIHYRGDLAVHHPSRPGAAHEGFHRLTGRNRVFLARRRLPWVLAVVYCAVWTVLGLARAGSARAAGDLLRGSWEGLRAPCGPRQPIRWTTAWRMTRLGRPPIL